MSDGLEDIDEDEVAPVLSNDAKMDARPPTFKRHTSVSYPKDFTLKV